MTETAPALDRRAALKERHRQAIVDAAAALMADGGTDFTVDELAERADVSRRTVFNHFGSVDDIIAAVCADVLGGVVASFVARAAAAPVRALAPSPGSSSTGADSGRAVSTRADSGRAVSVGADSRRAVSVGADSRRAVSVGADSGRAVSTGAVSTMFDEVVHAVRTTDLVTPMAYLTRTLGLPDEPSPWRGALLLRSFHDVSEWFGAAMAQRHPDADRLEVQLLVNSVMSGLMVLYPHWLERTGAADDDDSRAVWSELLDQLVAAIRTGHRTVEGGTGGTRSDDATPSRPG